MSIAKTLLCHLSDASAQIVITEQMRSNEGEGKPPHSRSYKTMLISYYTANQ